MSAAFDSLEIVGLRRLDGSKSGTATHYIDNQCRQLGGGDIGNAFLLEAHARRRRRCHHGFARGGTAVYHVYGRHFAFGLEHDHAGGFPGLELGKSLENFALGGDGITEVTVDAVADCGVGYGFVALH